MNYPGMRADIWELFLDAQDIMADMVRRRWLKEIARHTQNARDTFELDHANYLKIRARHKAKTTAIIRAKRDAAKATDQLGVYPCLLCGGMIERRRSGDRHVGICSR